MKTTSFHALLFVLLIVALPERLVADALYDKLRDFFAAQFPGEGYLPCPYGADSRFAPKTIWVQVNNAQNKPWKSGKSSAWVVFSDGASIYPDSLVKLRENAIDTQDWKLDTQTKFALAAAVAGKTDWAGLDADVKVALDKKLDIEVELGEVAVVYGQYFDYLAAQKLNEPLLTAMNAILQERFGAKVPPRRVIVSAIRARGTVIRMNTANQSEFGAEAGLGALLKKLGLKWNRDKKVYSSLETKDWRNIAYVALLADPQGRISATGTDSTAWSDFAQPLEDSAVQCLWCPTSTPR